ncbi:MAG TPA: HlyD family efflux transporter periplasmic adaptor subunit [Bryobacteraceae bacterium]|nr:HlyD family efflux transporter periplasmic adaptor subunit [Bryobacteraceae bacterium]
MWKRWLWIIVLVGVVLAGAFFAIRPQPVVVETTKVARGPFRVTVEEEGKTRIRDRFVVSAPVAGFLRRIRVNEGDMVQAGDVAAVLEPLRAEVLDVRSRETNEARLKVAEAGVGVAQARVATAEQQARAAVANATYWAEQLLREQKLAQSGDIAQERLARTRSEADRSEATRRAAETEIVTARADVERARADVAAARAALLNPAAADRVERSASELVSVRWPVTGRVLRVVKESEGVVQSGDPLVELGNVRALEVEVEVLSADAVKMKPGTPLELTRWGGEGLLTGMVRVVEPAGFTKVSALGVEEQRVRVIADITSPEDEWQRLGEGYRVESIFVLWEGKEVLQVPASALFREGAKWFVFAVDGGVARRREVQIGHRSGLAAEITSGLKEGDVVIPHPDESVTDGKDVSSSS